MTKKARTYQDYRKLGKSLHNAKKHLQNSFMQATRMFPKTSGHARKLKGLLDRLSQLRSALDDDFCNEISEDAIPAGQPRFPLYPGPGRGNDGADDLDELNDPDRDREESWHGPVH